MLLHTCECVLQRVNPAVKAHLQPLSTQNAFACRVLFNLSAPDETVLGVQKWGPGASGPKNNNIKLAYFDVCSPSIGNRLL